MNLLQFKFNFLRLKFQYESFLKLKEKYNSKNIEKNKFIKFFIKDEEDKILNKKVLNKFDKQIQKYKLKIYKKQNKIDKILFGLNIVDLNYINYLYNYKISKNDTQIIKNILKEKIE